LAAAQVNAEAFTVHSAVVEDASSPEGLLSSGGGEAAVDARIVPVGGFTQELPQAKVLDLGGDLRRERAGVEGRDRTGAAAACDLRLEQFRNAVARRRDDAHPGDDNSSSHSEFLHDGHEGTRRKTKRIWVTRVGSWVSDFLRVLRVLHGC